MKNEDRPKDKYLPLRDEAIALLHPAAAAIDDVADVDPEPAA